MDNEQQYMADFMAIFETIERWGPGSDADTLRALQLLPKTPQTILDIGCGKGFSTRVLANHTQAQITAIDTAQNAVDTLQQYIQTHDLNSRVQVKLASMNDLSMGNNSFDCLWAETCVYIMGFEKALNQWKSLISEEGFLVVNDLIWKVQIPSPEAHLFWTKEYSDMQSLETRLTQIDREGYQLIDHFALSEQAWFNYYGPLKERVKQLKQNNQITQALIDTEREIDIFERFGNEISYQMFILRKR